MRSAYRDALFSEFEIGDVIKTRHGDIYMVVSDCLQEKFPEFIEVIGKSGVVRAVFTPDVVCKIGKFDEMGKILKRLEALEKGESGSNEN